jgi:hypothetical protein
MKWNHHTEYPWLWATIKISNSTFGIICFRKVREGTSFVTSSLYVEWIQSHPSSTWCGYCMVWCKAYWQCELSTNSFKHSHFPCFQDLTFMLMEFKHIDYWTFHKTELTWYSLTNFVSAYLWLHDINSSCLCKAACLLIMFSWAHFPPPGVQQRSSSVRINSTESGDYFDRIFCSWWYNYSITSILLNNFHRGAATPPDEWIEFYLYFSNLCIAFYVRNLYLFFWHK